MRKVALAEVAEINPRSEQVSADEAVSFVGMAELDAVSATARPLETRPFGAVSKGYTVFRDQDLLVAKITPCFENGKVGQAILDHPVGVGSTEFHVVRPRSGLDTRYLLHFLRRPQFRTTGELRMTGSGGQRRVPAAYLQELEVPLPPLQQQRRIAAILDHADALRSKRCQVLAHLDSLPASIFEDMFGEENSIVEFGSVIERGPTNGLYRPAKDYGDGSPILRIDGFNAGRVLSRAWKRVRITSEERDRYGLAIGDIVVNRVNALSHLGKSALIETLTEPSVYESNMMRIRLDRAKVTPQFAIAWLQTGAVKAQVLSKAKKAINQASINQTDVKTLTMPLPALGRQQEFAARVEAIDSQRMSVEQSRQKDDELFASLRSRAFRGDL